MQKLIPQKLVDDLRRAQHVFALTGAGASADSGVPTFRDAQTGLWEKYDASELATPEAFVANPERVWRWYCWRRELVVKASPNAAHFALVDLARLVTNFTLVTQNVDGLHQRAGSSDVIELHGNLLRNRCFACACDVSGADLTVRSPRCPACGDRIRPDVVWFGEQLPLVALERATEAANGCDVFLSIGTASLVWPAAGLADIAALNGATLVEVNPEPTTLSTRCDHRIADRASRALPALVSRIGSRNFA